MKLFINTTSPFARLARIALLEKGIPPHRVATVNPWADDPDLLAVNTAARVPTLVTDDGAQLTESLLIVLRLEHSHPEPSLLTGDADRILMQAGIAYGVIEAAVHSLVGRLIVGGAITDPAFDTRPVGLRRRRSMLTGLARLDADPPVYRGGVPDLAVITTVIAIDYVRFRFGACDWLTPFPAIESLSTTLADRPAFAETTPVA